MVLVALVHAACPDTRVGIAGPSTNVLVDGVADPRGNSYLGGNRMVVLGASRAVDYVAFQ